MGSTSRPVYLLDRDEAETTRLNNQHHFLVELSNLIHPSIPKDGITAVADLGTGTGVWLEDVANLLPNKSVYLHGFDISSVQFPRGHKIQRPGQNPIPLSVHNALIPFPEEHREINGWIQWEEVDHTAFCTDAVPELAAITQLRESVIKAMLKLGLCPFAPQRVFGEISVYGFADIVRETYTTAGKDNLQPFAKKWVAGVMRALAPNSLVITGQAQGMKDARGMIEKLILEFEAHCESASALVNLGVTVGRKVR
ncbi:uncharacterized protein N7479_006830 [Penicillium vulpinum]|uniref:uncharacterized protein n=1 Tax=Penicillium vulpinum TaxID=29845 RepID=UPI002549484B|nr:uncharacterized protein N7479_006830 [Penicillium vulpinum]KAJ5959680.1 hypothetical protein N7479_006830 [Penicillium vulpinum]